MPIFFFALCNDFNPRSPQGGATAVRSVIYHCRQISIHAPRKGERQGKVSIKAANLIFQSTLPARGSDYIQNRPAGYRYISIHAPRKGERHENRRYYNTAVLISIHAPRKGERPCGDEVIGYDFVFQSTLPARGSDYIRLIQIRRALYFNPRSPQGGATPARYL